MDSPLAEFSKQLACILPEMGSERLPALLVSMLNSLTPFDNAVIVGYSTNDIPRVYYNTVPPSEQVSQIDRFVNGAYLLDPFYRAAVDQGRRGFFRLSDLAPQGFDKSEYYRSYFKHTSIRDEAGYLIALSGDRFINLSLGRINFSQRFNRRQIALLADITDTVQCICQMHWDNSLSAPSMGNHLPSQLDSALNHFGTAFLTERESQVIQLFLHGHSTKSIAEKLDISPETVKLHRKKSYAKLDVSSQAELFHLFIDSLASLENYSGGDPLVGYI